MSQPHPKFTWLGHATLRVYLPTGETLVIDPWLAGNPACPPAAGKFARLDLILVTHAHSDHMGDALALAREHGAPVISNYDLCTYLEAQGAPRTSGMNLGGTQEVCGVSISMVRADHSSGFFHDGLPVYGGLAAGFVVRGDGWSFYFAGDTALFSDMGLIAELYHPQLAFRRSATTSPWTPARRRSPAAISLPGRWCQSIGAPSRCCAAAPPISSASCAPPAWRPKSCNSCRASSGSGAPQAESLAT